MFQVADVAIKLLAIRKLVNSLQRHTLTRTEEVDVTFETRPTWLKAFYFFQNVFSNKDFGNVIIQIICLSVWFWGSLGKRVSNDWLISGNRALYKVVHLQVYISDLSDQV